MKKTLNYLAVFIFTISLFSFFPKTAYAIGGKCDLSMEIINKDGTRYTNQGIPYTFDGTINFECSTGIAFENTLYTYTGLIYPSNIEGKYDEYNRYQRITNIHPTTEKKFSYNGKLPTHTRGPWIIKFCKKDDDTCSQNNDYAGRAIFAMGDAPTATPVTVPCPIYNGAAPATPTNFDTITLYFNRNGYQGSFKIKVDGKTFITLLSQDSIIIDKNYSVGEHVVEISIDNLGAPSQSCPSAKFEIFPAPSGQPTPTVIPATPTPTPAIIPSSTTAPSVTPTGNLPPCKKDARDPNGKCNIVESAIGDIPTDPAAFVKTIFTVLLSMAGGWATYLIIVAGYGLMFSHGEAEKVKEAREEITSAIVGIVFMLLSLVILRVIGVDIFALPTFN